MQAQFARRLAALGLVSTALWLVILVLTFVFPALGLRDLSDERRMAARLLALLAAADGLGVWWTVRRRKDRLGPALRNMAVLYQAGTALAFGVLDALPILTTESRPLGAPGVAIWLVFFPALVPLDRLRSVVGSVLSVGAAAGAFGLMDWLGYSSPAPVMYVWLVVTLCIAAVLGQVPATVVRRLSRQVSEALDLGAYRLERILGAGGMGEVWVARHRALARPAAIKLIRPTSQRPDAADPRVRFAREARVTANLRSPHTVEVYDYGVAADGRFYYAMELLDGFDLDSLVRAHGPQPPARVVAWLIQACDSLGEAHAAGLVHRDVKPANLMVCPWGPGGELVKVLDFGLVRPTAHAEDARLTREGALAGTPAFMSPEHALGEALDGRADLYALGCVAWWLLTGQPVFAAKSAAALVVCHLRDAPPHLPAERGPAALDAVLQRCLAKAPADRYPDAQALADALEAVAAELPAWDRPAAAAWWADHQPEVHPSSSSVELAATVAP